MEPAKVNNREPNSRPNDMMNKPASQKPLEPDTLEQSIENMMSEEKKTTPTQNEKDNTDSSYFPRGETPNNIPTADVDEERGEREQEQESYANRKPDSLEREHERMLDEEEETETRAVSEDKERKWTTTTAAAEQEEEGETKTPCRARRTHQQAIRRKKEKKKVDDREQHRRQRWAQENVHRKGNASEQENGRRNSMPTKTTHPEEVELNRGDRRKLAEITMRYPPGRRKQESTSPEEEQKDQKRTYTCQNCERSYTTSIGKTIA